MQKWFRLEYLKSGLCFYCKHLLRYLKNWTSIFRYVRRCCSFNRFFLFLYLGNLLLLFYHSLTCILLYAFSWLLLHLHFLVWYFSQLLNKFHLFPRSVCIAIDMAFIQHQSLSQGSNKHRGACSVCHQIHQLHLRSNTVRLHGPRTAPCLGSNRAPLELSGPSGIASTQPNLNRASPANLFASTDDLHLPGASSSSGPPPGDFTDLSDLSALQNASSAAPAICPNFTHPNLVLPIIKRIPKSARPACCLALADILNIIIRNSSEVAAWSKLLHFAPNILWTPPKALLVQMLVPQLNLGSVIKSLPSLKIIDA